MSKKVKVYGVPGSGKTTFLLDIVRQAVHRGIARPSEIGFISFSRAAAHEARQRVLDVLPGYESDEFCHFGTIHSRCRELLQTKSGDLFTGKWLREFAKETGYELSDGSQDAEALFHSGSIYTYADICRAAYGFSRHKEISLRDATSDIARRVNSMEPVRLSRVEHFVQKYEKFKRPGGIRKCYDFEDLLESVIEQGLRLPVKILIVDEVQDLSGLLFRVVDQWAAQAELTIIAGDAYQAIYEFQGAAPRRMLEWQADRVLTLDKSYRCPAQVYACARGIVERMQDRYENDDFLPSRQGGFVIQSDFDYELLKGCDSVYLLARTNAAVNGWTAYLQREGIPFGFVGDRRKVPYQTKAAKTVWYLERLRRDGGLTRIEYADMLESIRSKGNLVRGAKKKSKRDVGDVEPGYEYPREIFLETLPERGFTEEGVDRVKSGAIYDELTGVNKEMESYVQALAREHGTDFVDRKPSLRIGTMHSAKGKEADIVLIDPSLPKRVQKEMRLAPEPEHRLAYVAVTRAKEGVVILPPRKRVPGKFYAYPSDYFEISHDRGEGLNRREAINEIFSDLQPEKEGFFPGVEEEDSIFSGDLPF